VEYIIVTLLAISATTFVIYMLFNKVFGVYLRLKSLLLCAVCSLVISVIIPRIVVSFAGLAGTVGFLAVFAVICAYVVSYYDDPSDLHPVQGATASGAALQPELAASGVTEIVSDLPPTIELPLFQQQPTMPPESPTVAEPVLAAAPLSAVEETVFIATQPPVAIASDNSFMQPHQEIETTVDFAGLVFGAAAQDLNPELDQPSLSDDAYLDGEEDGQAYSVPYLSITKDPESPFIPEDEPEFDQDLLADTSLEMMQLSSFLPFAPAPDPTPEPVLQTTVESDPLPQSEAELVSEALSTANNKSKSKSKSKAKAAATPEPELPPEVVMAPESNPEPGIQQLTSDILALSPAADISFAAQSSMPDIPAPEHALDILPAAENSSENLEVTAITTPVDLSPVSDSLDDLLDFAFSRKELHNYPLALDTFRQAMKLYQDSDAAPYIAIEIAALLKDKGAYDEAIMILTQSRNLPGLQHNDPLSQEFITTIAYLRIVKNILLESRMGYLPFSSIPTEVSQEIDAEFREWRNLA